MKNGKPKTKPKRKEHPGDRWHLFDHHIRLQTMRGDMSQEVMACFFTRFFGKWPAGYSGPLPEKVSNDPPPLVGSGL